jgi:hypothetical protein
MKKSLVLLMITTGPIFSLLTFAQSATHATNTPSITQPPLIYHKEDSPNWELLILLGVIGFIGIKNRNSVGRKLNSEDTPVQLED